MHHLEAVHSGTSCSMLHEWLELQQTHLQDIHVGRQYRTISEASPHLCRNPNRRGKGTKCGFAVKCPVLNQLRQSKCYSDWVGLIPVGYKHCFSWISICHVLYSNVVWNLNLWEWTVWKWLNMNKKYNCQVCIDWLQPPNLKGKHYFLQFP